MTIKLVESTERTWTYRATAGAETYDVLIERTNLGSAPWIVQPPGDRPYLLAMAPTGAPHRLIGHFASQDEALGEAAARLGISPQDVPRDTPPGEAQQPTEDIREHYRG